MEPTENRHDIIVRPSGQLGRAFGTLPALITARGDHATRRFLEFFTANIRNRNTREAYARAVGRFFAWCDGKGLALEQLEPMIVAAYVEQLGETHEKPSVKQHLAAIRMLFDWLVIGQVVPSNPASSVRGPKHVVKKGRTPVLSPEEARVLIDSIDVSTPAGLRDRALIGLMVYSFARVSAAVSMDADDYYQQGKRFWFRLHEKGGKEHTVPAHHKAEEYMDAYLAAVVIAGQKKAPLFRTLDRRRRLTDRRLHRLEALAMIKRRARVAGLPDNISCHTFRATGITAYLLGGGTLDDDQPYCLPCRELICLGNRDFSTLSLGTAA